MAHKKFGIRFAVILFWITVWSFFSLVVPDILFAGPIETMQSLLQQIQHLSFWLSIMHSLSKIILGFFLAFLAGVTCAILAYRFSVVALLLQPAIQIMKAVPVACFIVVSLIWMRAPYISVLVSFFVVFPIIYLQLLQGLLLIDSDLVEMAHIFRVPLCKKIKILYFSQTIPYLITGCQLGIGMAWKAGIAGEIIGLPNLSIGEQLYLSKLYLDTGSLFAWTIVIIIISLLCEKLMVYVLHKVEVKWRTIQ